MNAILEQALARLAVLGIVPKDVEIVQTRRTIMRSDCAEDSETETWALIIHGKHAFYEVADRLDQAIARVETLMGGTRQ